jgi:GAF domain-containing protein
MDSGQEKFIFEQKITDAEGNVRWLQTVKRPLIDEDGVARHVLGVSSDITERKLLEQVIQESLKRRAQQVQTSTEVAQEIAAAPALDELFRRVVTLIKERFGYYHAQIFRYDPEIDAMVLVVGYGETGEKMLAAGHQLPAGRGVVGTAAVTHRPILATDVAKDPDWVPNRFLPDTKGELAVPIILRQTEILGILDVQSEVAGALTEEDQLLLEGLCGQIAIAIDATRARQEMEERLRELETCQSA